MQLVTCIPTNCVPRQLALGAVTGHEIEMMERRTTDIEPDDLSDDLGQRGQILWIRGITRLQHQVSVVSVVAISSSCTRQSTHCHHFVVFAVRQLTY